MKDDATSYLEHGRPLVFGRDRNKGIMLDGLELQVVALDGKVTEDDLLRHDEQRDDPSLAYMLARMTYPEFPEPMGVFRCVERPTYEDMLMEQIEESVRVRGRGKLEDLFDNGETWIIN
jgi:2-oxoglutarate ferredoxin oxidoreductase subunit beta